MAGRNPVTIAVLAKELGLGKATISLALRDDPRIRKQTRERVQRHADKRGYAANPMVAHVMSQLRSAKVSDYRATIALVNVAPREDAIRTNVTFRTIADGFRKRATGLSYSVEDLWIGDELFADPDRLKKVFQTRKIEGMAFIGVAERALLPEPVHVLLSRSVFVGLGVRLTQPLVHCCANNQFVTAMMATRKLLGSGFSRVGLVTSRLSIGKSTDGSPWASVGPWKKPAGGPRRLPEWCGIRAMLRLLIKQRPICSSGSPKMPNQQSIADS